MKHLTGSLSESASRTLSRREFFGTTAALAAAGILPAASLRAQNSRPSATNRITMGVIGAGNQGINDLKRFLNDERVQIVAVSDVNRESGGYWSGRPGGREVARKIIEEREAERAKSGRYQGCDTYADYREILARDDIDTVLIATPDHWHALQVVEAAKARKDIYGQKPLSLTIDEGRVMSDAVKQAERVFQTGSQQRSNGNFRRAVNLVQNGYIGKLKTIRVGLPGGRPDFAGTADRKLPEPVPDGFDYNSWLGPASLAPYAPARCHVNFRWIYDYSGGMVTDWGAHHVDCAQWGAGTDRTGPVEIRNISGTFPPDPLWNTAAEFHFEALFENGLEMIIGSDQKTGVTWEGSDGWVYADRGSFQASSEELRTTELSESDRRTYHSDDHYRNFIDCVISREETAAPVEVAHRSITICHLGNISLRLGRKRLRWDPEREQILDDPGAADMQRVPYRSPWRFPRVS